jgi:hypothetical protein
VPLLVTRLYDRASAATLLDTVQQYGRSSRPKNVAKLVSFGADGVFIFQGVGTSVIV